MQSRSTVCRIYPPLDRLLDLSLCIICCLPPCPLLCPSTQARQGECRCMWRHLRLQGRHYQSAQGQQGGAATLQPLRVLAEVEQQGQELLQVATRSSCCHGV